MCILATLPLIAACGGGGGAGNLSGLNNTPTASAKTYETMDALTDATTHLDVSMLKNQTDFVSKSGTYSASTQSVTHVDTTDVSDLEMLTGMDYVMGIEYADYQGFIGVTTAADDIPTTTTTYSGSATARVTYNNVSYDLTNGISDITLAMGNVPNLNVDMTFNDPADPIDQIVFQTSTFDGSRFSGGTVDTLKNNTAVDIAQGDNIQSLGNLYGPNAENIAGQIIATAGDGNNSLWAMFVGKQ
jgi:hypothetical protein